MARRKMLWALPLAVLTVLAGWMLLAPRVLRGAEERIASPALLALEKRLGHHIYAPTWLPEGGHPGPRDVMEGQYRIIQDFDGPEERLMVLLAQERRTPERDRYHERLFARRWEARADVNGTPGFLVTGSNGERRLYWTSHDTALILSSNILSDDQLVRVAKLVR